MADLRRDNARRSYRSKASNRFVSFDRIVANLAGPPCAVVRNFSMKVGSGTSASLGVRNCLMTLNFIRVSARELIAVPVGQCLGKELMARITYAAQIDLRFGDSACENLDMNAGVPPRDLTREGLHLFSKRLVRLDGEAQTVAERIFCRAGTAMTGFRPGARPSVRAVGFNLAIARQAAFFPLAGVVSITSNSWASTSCTLRRSASPSTVRRRSISRKLALRRFSAIVVRRSIRST